jgi:hypothetical protein
VIGYDPLLNHLPHYLVLFIANLRLCWLALERLVASFPKSGLLVEMHVHLLTLVLAALLVKLGFST